MIPLRQRSGFLIRSLFLCILISVIGTSTVAFTQKRQLITDFQEMLFLISANKEFNANLYYTFTNQFQDSLFLSNNSKHLSDTLSFRFSKQEDIIKQFRLDLGRDTNLSSIKIRELHLIFKDKVIKLNEDEVFESLFVHSESVTLDKKNKLIAINKYSKPFDPYVVFAPLGQISRPKHLYMAALLLPFILWVLFCIIKYRSWKEQTWQEILNTLFIVCIPLKIAWTTFCTLLLSGYAVLKLLKTGKPRSDHTVSIILLLIFGIYAVLGRPDQLSAIDKEFALILFAFIGMVLPLSTLNTYWAYSLTFLILNAILVSAGISYLIWFHDFYALGVVDYFREIKIFSGNVRDWLYYDHAAFLSFFGIVGLIFAKELYDRALIDRRLLYIYHALLIAAILLMGSRICVIIYLLFLLNNLLRCKPWKRVLINVVVFIVFCTSIGLNIDRIDPNRHQLWSVSWEAIKESPWLGYGLGGAEKILKDEAFNRKAGFLLPSSFNHAHNQIITSILEIGLVGTMGILLVLGVFIMRSEQINRKNMILFLTGLGYIFITESILQTSKPLYVICFLFLLLAQNPRTEINKSLAS